MTAVISSVTCGIFVWFITGSDQSSSPGIRRADGTFFFTVSCLSRGWILVTGL